jgi:hypothetical protein
LLRYYETIAQTIFVCKATVKHAAQAIAQTHCYCRGRCPRTTGKSNSPMGIFAGKQLKAKKANPKDPKKLNLRSKQRHSHIPLDLTLQFVEHLLRSLRFVYFLSQTPPKPLCRNPRRPAPSWNLSSPVEAPPLRISLLTLLPMTLSRTVMAMLLRIHRHSIPTMTRLLFRYWCGPFCASSGHPV